MHRWWTKKGISATVEELKKALDFINMAYIHEEYFDNMRKNLTSYTGSEGDLDISEISDDDPDVSRLIQEYNVRSLNTSYDYDSAAEASRYSLSTESIMRKLNKRGLITRRGKYDSSRDSAGQTRSNSSRLNSSRESIDYTSDTGDGHRRSFVIVQPQLKSGDYRHETNL
ncbi:hypothetical protein NP493_6709g00005 [Ridgeia piscesae]|uniref:Uncharacterized protein n=1 Tax=Ridgeia piscesae TaxID=27915 RepID=A0AAD9IRU1_RIDPI|nr:hypothetical protein NP493_6709g00005 [Ridgeia piscesae]